MAEWHVNGSVTSSGDGTSAGQAFKTIGEAVAAMSGGDMVNVAGGVYPETVSLSGKSGTEGSPTRLMGDPLDPFVITGGETLPGLVPCILADAAYVGDNWTSMRKTTVAASIFPDSDPFAGNLCEDGVQMPICVERAITTDRFFLTKSSYYHQADSITKSGSLITGFIKPAVTDPYTKEQIENSTCRFIHSSNRGGSSAVTFNTGTDEIELFEPQTWAGLSNAFNDYFALFNLLPSLKPGEWGYRVSGSDVVIYVRATGTVEYSARAVGLDLSGCDHVEAAHFIVRQVSSPDADEAPLLISNGTKRSGVHAHHFELNDSYGGKGYAPLYVNGANDYHIHDFKIARAQSMFGMFFQGSGASNADWPRMRMAGSVSLSEGTVITGATSGETATVRFTTGVDIYCGKADSDKPFVVGETINVGRSPAGTVSNLSKWDNKGDASLVNQDERGHVHDFEIDYVASAAIRMFTVKDLAIHHGIIRQAAKATHGNTWNPYQGCHNVLIWGVNGQDSDGYATHQESDSLVMAFCALSASTTPNGGNRAYDGQQNRYSEHPGNVYGWKGSYFLNMRGIPVPARVTSSTLGNGISLSSSFAPLDLWTVHNSIFHGDSAEGGSALADWDHNINTKPSGAGSGTRGANDVVVGALDLYTDPINGDFSYPPGSAVRTFAAKDWSALIPGFKTRWPQVNTHATALGRADPFTLDMVGDTISWAIPPVGPTVDPDADYRAAPVSGGPVVPPPPVRPVVRSRVLRLSVLAA